MKIKVVCLNVWIGGVLFEPMMEYLKMETADIYLLQEVFNGNDQHLEPKYRTFSEVQKQLDLPFAHFAPCFNESVGGRDIVQGNAILSKFPLREVSVTYYDVPFGTRDNSRSAFHLSPRSLQHVVANVSDSNLHLLNTQGIWGEDGWDSPRRLKMAQHILHEIDNHTPLVLAGDFNLQPKTETITMIEAKLSNVFKNELTTTFNVKRKDLVKYPGYSTAVVDMFFITPDIKVTEHYCPNVDVSDHYPLVVLLDV